MKCDWFASVIPNNIEDHDCKYKIEHEYIKMECESCIFKMTSECNCYKKKMKRNVCVICKEKENEIANCNRQLKVIVEEIGTKQYENVHYIPVIIQRKRTLEYQIAKKKVDRLNMIENYD